MSDTVELLLVGLFLVMLILLWYHPIAESKRRAHPSADAIRLCTVLSLFLWPLWLVAAIWAYNAPRPNKTQEASDGPGRFRVLGVDRESGFDTELVIDASSAANAKAKAELKGMIPTDVARL